MAEIATIARPYAEALFQSAKADLGAAAAWLEPLAAVAGNAQLQQFAGNPKVTDQRVFDVIAGVTRTALPETGKNFLRTIANAALTRPQLKVVNDQRGRLIDRHEVTRHAVVGDGDRSAALDLTRPDRKHAAG